MSVELALAQDTINALLNTGFALTTSVAGGAIIELIKEKLGAAGRVEVLEKVQQNPNDEQKQKLLVYALAELLVEQPELGKELTRLLGKNESNSQTAVNTGAGATVTQISGNNNTVTGR